MIILRHHAQFAFESVKMIGYKIFSAGVVKDV
jgi:hypothetical protein